MQEPPFSQTNFPPWLIRLAEWVLLFVVLLVAIWTATQSRAAPQLILLALLYVITSNFSLPPSRGAVGLAPAVAITSLLVLGLETAVWLLVAGLFLADLLYPLWRPVWDNLDVERPAWWQRLATNAVYLLALLPAAFVYRWLGGQAPLADGALDNLRSLVALAGVYAGAYFVLAMLLWRSLGRPWSTFFQDSAFLVLTLGFLSQPFAVFGGVTFFQSGLPAFVIYCLSLAVFSVLFWLSWQRHFVLERQLLQFAALNSASASLRETLDLPEVLARTYQQVNALIRADSFFIVLVDEQGRWQRPFLVDHRYQVRGETFDGAPFTVDDLTRWVAAQKRVLALDHRNMHFAKRHQLALPNPTPAAWLGVPLTLSGAERALGVMALQRFAPHPPFSRWSREVLLAVAGQASAAIQNARLYSETLRLYNLTDEALARRVEQLQALLNSMQEGVLMADTGGRIVLVNPVAAALLEQPAEALPGQALAQTAAAALGYTAPALSARWAGLSGEHSTAVATPEPAVYQVYRATDGDGRRRRFIQRHEAPVLSAGGRVMGWLMLFRDVTEEQELAEQKDDLMRMVVHDLRNPLTTLISHLNLVKGRQQAGTPAKLAEAEELLEDARRGCLDLLDMVDSLMDVNRLEAGQLAVDAEAMRLPPLLEQVLQRLQPLAAQKQIEMTFTCEPDLPAAWADEEIVRRVLVNLLDNALKFTPAAGRIHGRLQSEPPLSPAHEPGLRCTISDTGPGIPPAFREQIFERFMRTNPGGAQVRGTGLGLTFCKLAIEAHGGRIWVEDGPQSGSRFIFTLPGIPLFTPDHPSS